jgi:ATP:corrinoid adenosyltransferase
MSIFSSDRDFSNIPEQTSGETIKQSTQKRSNKKQASKEEWNKIEPAKKTSNNLQLFDEIEPKQNIKEKIESWFGLEWWI